MQHQTSHLSQRHSSRRPRSHPRRGLAPLELVLNLPVLLFTMGLIVNFGVMATWKVRANATSRDALWRSRAIYQAAGDPNPSNWWPDSATMSSGGGSDLTTVSGLWNQPALAHPFARGPVVAPPNGNGAYLQVYDRDYLEMQQGVRQGSSHVEQTMPFLTEMLPGGYEFNIEQELLDSRWQYQTMGFGWNEQRRAKNWYNIDTAGDWAAERARFLAADAALVGNPLGPALIPLDRDPEFLAWYDSFPDFHPRFSNICQIDANIVRTTQIINRGGLVDRIKGAPRQGAQAGIPGVARTMAERFKRMYEEQLRAVQMANPQPPNAAQLIQALQQKIDVLTQFLGTLPPV